MYVPILLEIALLTAFIVYERSQQILAFLLRFLRPYHHPLKYNYRPNLPQNGARRTRIHLQSDAIATRIGKYLSQMLSNGNPPKNRDRSIPLYRWKMRSS